MLRNPKKYRFNKKIFLTTESFLPKKVYSTTTFPLAVYFGARAMLLYLGKNPFIKFRARRNILTEPNPFAHLCLIGGRDFGSFRNSLHV